MGKEVSRLDVGAVLEHYGAAPATPRAGWTPIKCPFHDDSHASAAYNTTTNRFHCFVCGIHQDAVGIIMERENVDFKNAVRIAEEIIGQSADSIRDEPTPGRTLFGEKGNQVDARGNVGDWRSRLSDLL